MEALMLYSCFNPASGLYDYFKDNRELPINADLPTPSMPNVAHKGIGVAAIDAGRPLPSDAKPAGRGWQARGIIVRCGRGAMGGITDGGPGSLGAAWQWVTDGGWKWLAGGALAVWVVRRIG
jgi:hypothetical protein